jgi:hypothetical protein
MTYSKPINMTDKLIEKKNHLNQQIIEKNNWCKTWEFEVKKDYSNKF